MKKNFYLLVLTALCWACAKENDVPNTSFTKIYDHSNYNLDFHPLDVESLAGGYMILSTTVLDRSQFPGVQLIQIAEDGSHDTNYPLPAEVVAPTPNLMRIDSSFYFFAMDPVSLRVQLVSFDTGFANLATTPLNAPLYYPLAASLTSSGEFLLLSYDPVDRLSVLSIVDQSGSVSALAGYSIGPGSDVEEAIIGHYLKSEDRTLPFFCGQVGNSLYYFNGFFNYSHSLVFTDFGAAPAGVVQGQFTEGGISGLLPLSGNTFALAGYQFQNNFIYPSVALNTAGVSSSVDLYTGNAAEWRPYTPVTIADYTLNGIDYLIYAAETKSQQLALYFYEKNTGNFAGLTHIGFINPFTLSSLHVDENNHLVVLGTTYVAGRFRRIFLERLQPEKINELIFN